MSVSTLESMVGTRVLLLSPHADDVAYSIGGIVVRLSRQADVLLMTVFGRSGWALPAALRRKSVDFISALREQEDRAYCERRQLGYVRLPCPDSFVMGYDEATELCDVPNDDPRTVNVVMIIEAAVASLRPHFVIAPCAVGGHIDHHIVRGAAETLRQVDVLYYEDVPYSASLSMPELERRLLRQGKTPAVTVDIEHQLESKCADMWSYRSQTCSRTVREMLLHAGRVGAGNVRYAERLWRRANGRA